MPKIKPITPKELMRKLEKQGFVLQRTTGSHMIYKNMRLGTRANVPFHLREIPKGTLMSIIRESGLDKEEFKVK
jgi:predicted RNA binding protein YcfA (HicA-like mRNA interferase family)